MQMTGNTVLITGGGSGIGRGLAEAFHGLGNQVVIAGRRREVLEKVTAANPKMRSAVLDIENAEDIKRFAAGVKREFPALNVVIHNAGIARPEKLAQGETADAEAMVATNVLGPIRLNAALMPGLLKQPRAVVKTVTSGLAFVPLAMTPTYCATKAALHSWTESLRYQMKGSNVAVIELAPPYVQTELGGAQQMEDPRAMPLREYIAEVMAILTDQPDATEVLVERVKPMRFAEREGRQEQLFTQMNGAFAMPH